MKNKQSPGYTANRRDEAYSLSTEGAASVPVQAVSARRAGTARDNNFTVHLLYGPRDTDSLVCISETA